jgi:hypothetical protein
VPAARDHAEEPARLEGEVDWMEVSKAQRPRQLEQENRQLKHTVAELLLDKGALQAVVAKRGRTVDAEAGGQSDALGGNRLGTTRLRPDPDAFRDVAPVWSPYSCWPGTWEVAAALQ